MSLIEEKKPKKRGRKPKGGKILSIAEKNNNIGNYVSSIILHLKCSSESTKKNIFLSEFEYNPYVENVEAFSNTKEYFSELNYTTSKPIKNDTKNNSPIITENHITSKLKNINPNNSNKKSNCFWCTHPFNNHVVCIPKYIINDTYEVYGNFCSPPCAVAFLFEEKINTSTKWERYSMLCSLYKDIYKNNINPAPNPYYTLSTFLGNLSIEEYEELNKTNNVYTILNKPLTRILPKISESTNNIDIHTRLFRSQTKSNNTNMYRLSRNPSTSDSEKKESIWKFMK